MKATPSLVPSPRPQFAFEATVPQGQAQQKTRAFGSVGLSADGATVFLDDFGGNGETQARPRRFVE